MPQCLLIPARTARSRRPVRRPRRGLACGHRPAFRGAWQPAVGAAQGCGGWGRQGVLETGLLIDSSRPTTVVLGLRRRVRFRLLFGVAPCRAPLSRRRGCTVPPLALRLALVCAGYELGRGERSPRPILGPRRVTLHSFSLTQGIPRPNRTFHDLAEPFCDTFLRIWAPSLSVARVRCRRAQ